LIDWVFANKNIAEVVRFAICWLIPDEDIFVQFYQIQVFTITVEMLDKTIFADDWCSEME
jgi:hypothetical protein